ncbi:MAG: acetyl-CoA C-acetyltransferase [Candidatus Porifericomitaceae bacterium WSBS_2022_MAG_OTU9]
MDNHNIVIAAACRTAIGKFGGMFATVPAPQLGASVISALLERSGVKSEQIDDVIMGQVLTAGSGMNPARQAALAAGLPTKVPSMTINKVCGSGLKAVQLAANAIAVGDAEIVVAGGQENMSLAPHVLPNSRNGVRMGEWKLVDSMLNDGLWDVFNDYHMGVTAENIAKEYNISRSDQDDFALGSQHRAATAIAEGRFAKEIIPVKVPVRRGEPLLCDRDEFPRLDLKIEDLAKLRPAFDKEGTVTAGNASGINDGAAAVLLMSSDKAKQLGITPLAHITACATAGVDPAVMGTGPIPASRLCLEKAGWDMSQLDRVEANEAFAVQALCVSRELGLDNTLVNVNGGAIALGHPIGASGCRVLVSLLYELQRSGGKRGLATLCIGGGQGIAMAVESRT